MELLRYYFVQLLAVLVALKTSFEHRPLKIFFFFLTEFAGLMNNSLILHISIHAVVETLFISCLAIPVESRIFSMF